MTLPAQDNALSTHYPTVWLDKDGSEQQLQAAITSLAGNGAASILVLACSANALQADTLQPPLSACPVPVFGGVFPAIFYQENYLQQGTLVVALPFTVQIDLYRDISSQPFNIDAPSARFGTALSYTADSIILIDGIASTIEPFIHSVYEAIGGGNRVIGGGAGFADFIQRPCLFTPEGLIQDAALVIKLPVQLSNATGHGWKIMDGPYLVTESDGTAVKTLDYQPAFEIYRESIERHSAWRFDNNTFLDVVRNFPLGIASLHNDIVVRDPISRQENTLICVGNIPANAMVYILHGEKTALLQAAGLASQKAMHPAPEQAEKAIGITMVFDCISRASYLADNFNEELAALRQNIDNGKLFLGVLSIGEIANTCHGTLSLLNKSVVVATL